MRFRSVVCRSRRWPMVRMSDHQIQAVGRWTIAQLSRNETRHWHQDKTSLFLGSTPVAVTLEGLRDSLGCSSSCESAASFRDLDYDEGSMTLT